MDKKLFTSMAQTLRPRIIAYASSLCGNSCDAEDIAQDTLLKMWSLGDRLATYRSAEALAFTLVFNLYKDKGHGLSDEEYAEYEGSYIIRNGKKITDLAEIMPEIKANEEYSERLQRIINVNSMTSEELIEDMIYTEYPSPGLRQDILNTIHDGQTIQYF